MATLEENHENPDEQFLEAIRRANVAELENLADTFEFENDYCFLTFALQVAIQYRHPAIVEYLIKKFNLTPGNIGEYNVVRFFESSAIIGNIVIANILLNYFSPILETGGALDLAYKNGRLEFVRFMFRENLADKSTIEFMYSGENNIYLTENEYDDLLELWDRNRAFGQFTKPAKY